MKIPSLIGLMFLFLATDYGWGQNFQYITYGGGEVPFNKVNEVVQDHWNYLWIASDQGLFRFNGTDFEDYNSTLKSHYIRCLTSVNDSTILFSNDTGVHSLEYASGKVMIKPVAESSGSGEGRGYAGRVFVDSKGRIWIGQLDGSLILMANARSEPQSFKLLVDRKTPQMYFGEDSFGNIWVLLPGYGLYIYEAENISFRKLELPFSVAHFLVEGDSLLLAGERLEQWKLNARGEVVDRRFVVSRGTHFQYLCRDQAGTLFLASDRGLYSLRTGQKDTLIPVFGSNDPHRVEELPYSRINQLYFSSSQISPGGTLWVSTPNGLGLLFSSFFKSVTGMSHDNVFALGKGTEEEVLISQGNVYSIDIKNSGKHFTEVEDLNRITAICRAGNTNWFGSADGKLYGLSSDGILETRNLSDRGGGIFYMFTDHRGELWFCQAPTDQPIVGIGKLGTDGAIKYYAEEKGLKTRILAGHEGGQSELYVAGIGTDTYLYKYDSEADTFVNHSKPFAFRVSRNFEVHDISVDMRGMVWMGTTDGLLRYDTERVQRIDLGIYTTQEIRAVCTMTDGSVWLATATSGLIHLDPDGDYVRFDEDSGTPSKIASYRSLMLDKELRLWAGTAEGGVYSSQTQPAPMKTPSPLITEIIVNNRQLEVKEELLFSRKDLVLMKFVSLGFPGSETHYQYKYYKKDLDSYTAQELPWSDIPQEDRVRLERMEGGNYLLEVRAQQPGGYAWSKATAVAFSVREKWFATWWGIGLLLVTGAMFFWYGIRLLVLRKVGRLEATLFKAEKELHSKEALLMTQDKALKHQQEELKNLGVNIYLLHRLLRQLPQDADWESVLPYLEKLVQMPTGIDAFSLVYRKGNVLIHRGYKRGSWEPYYKENEFNEKANLASFVICTRKPLLIADFDQEARQFIGRSENEGYRSRVYVPFRQQGGDDALFCAYANKAGTYDQKSLIEFQILVLFLSRNIKGVLEKGL